MNPLKALPASTSKQFSLSLLDWKKILRAAIVQLLALFLSAGVPALLQWHYVFRGVDYTGIVVTLVGLVAEALRRFLAAQPKD
jgi:hypothetical protein